jgi:ubiquinone/menaquinone biosynthesis C-methylase UbiE
MVRAVTRPPTPNYDRLAPTYDQRFEAETSEGLPAFVAETLATLQPNRWLEVGCGTGRWLSLATGGQAIGLDRSAGMLAQARRRLAPGRLVQGEAGALPFAHEQFDLVLCVHALHHFPDVAGFLHQAASMLCPGASLVIAGLDAHDPDLSWYVYDFFEGVLARDRRRYPPWSGLEALVSSIGLRPTERGRAESIRQVQRGRQVLADPFLRPSSTSQLALLSEPAYRAGLARIEAVLESDPQRDFETRLEVQYLRAVRP